MALNLSTDLNITTGQAEVLLEQWLGKPVSCGGIRRLLGGEIHSAFALDFDREPGRAVIKLRVSEDESFEGEKDRLDYLRQKGVRVPLVYAVGSPDEQTPFSYILLEHVSGVTLDAARLTEYERIEFEKEFAEEVLNLHANTRDTFGEINGRFATKKWADIVVPRLVDMREEMSGRLPADVLSQIDVALDSAEAVFAESQSVPTLIHGDLWAGNIMIDKKDGQWLLSGLIDPGTQYADVEHELAYLQCFNTVGEAFFNAYTSRTPMRPGFELRKLYYWLNTMMIHVWLFDAAQYRSRTARIARDIVAQVSE